MIRRLLASTALAAALAGPAFAQEAVRLSPPQIAIQAPFTAVPKSVKHDGVILSDGAMTAASHTLTSASAAFTAALVGKPIVVAYEGGAETAWGWDQLYSQALDGDTHTFGSATFTMRTSPTLGNDVQIGADFKASAANLAAACHAQTLTILADCVANQSVITVTANTPGAAGDAIALATSAGGVTAQTIERADISAPTLMNGADAGADGSKTATGTITGYTDANTISTSFAATTTLSALQFAYGTDDCAHLAALKKAHKTFMLPAGVYMTSCPVTTGARSTYLAEGTDGADGPNFVPTQALSYVFGTDDTNVANVGQQWSNIRVTGFGLPTLACFRIGLHVVQGNFQNLDAADCGHAGGANWLAEALQNNWIVGARSENATTHLSTYGLRVINGAGNNRFLSLDANSASVNHVIEDIDTSQPGYALNLFSNAKPTKNTFDGQEEQGPSTMQSGLRLINAAREKFTDFTLTSAGTSAYDLEASPGATNIRLENPWFFKAGHIYAFGSAAGTLILNNAQISGWTSSTTVCQTWNTTRFTGDPGMLASSYSCNPNGGSVNKAQELQTTAIYVATEPMTTTSPGVLQGGFGIGGTTGQIYGQGKFAAYKLAHFDPPLALTDGANVTPDPTLSTTLTWTMAASRNLKNPGATKFMPGDQWDVFVTEGGAGGWAIAYDTNYVALGAGTLAGLLDTTAGHVTWLRFRAISASVIYVAKVGN